MNFLRRDSAGSFATRVIHVSHRLVCERRSCCEQFCPWHEPPLFTLPHLRQHPVHSDERWHIMHACSGVIPKSKASCVPVLLSIVIFRQKVTDIRPTCYRFFAGITIPISSGIEMISHPTHLGIIFTQNLPLIRCWFLRRIVPDISRVFIRPHNAVYKGSLYKFNSSLGQATYLTYIFGMLRCFY